MAKYSVNHFKIKLHNVHSLKSLDVDADCFFHPYFLLGLAFGPELRPTKWDYAWNLLQQGLQLQHSLTGTGRCVRLLAFSTQLRGSDNSSPGGACSYWRSRHNCVALTTRHRAVRAAIGVLDTIAWLWQLDTVQCVRLLAFSPQLRGTDSSSSTCPTTSVLGSSSAVGDELLLLIKYHNKGVIYYMKCQYQQCRVIIQWLILIIDYWITIITY